MNRTTPNLIIVLAVVAGILVFGILAAASSLARSRYDAKVAEVESQAKRLAEDDDVKEEAAARIETLERENADLKKQLKQASADLRQQADRLTAAEQEVTLLRRNLDAALQELAELRKKYAVAVTTDVAPVVPNNAVADRVVKQAPAVVEVEVDKAKAAHVVKKKGHKHNGNVAVAAAPGGRGAVNGPKRVAGTIKAVDAAAGTVTVTVMKKSGVAEDRYFTVADSTKIVVAKADGTTKTLSGKDGLKDPIVSGGASVKVMSATDGAVTEIAVGGR